MARSGQWNEGSEFVIELYKDLLLAGSGIEGIEGSWDEGMRRARQSTYKAWSLKGRLDREMDQASTEFRQAIGTRRANREAPRAACAWIKPVRSSSIDLDF